MGCVCHLLWLNITPNGAQTLVSQAGASKETVELIRRHHDPHLPNPGTHTERLLAALQAADNES